MMEFFTINQEQKMSLMNGFKLICEEFYLQNIKSRKRALHYLNDRFSILLKQYLFRDICIEFSNSD